MLFRSRRKEMVDQGATGRLVSVSKDGGEDAEEERRVLKVVAGESSVGQDDLARIFSLKPIPMEKDPGLAIQQINGTTAVKPAVFQTVSSSREVPSKGVSAGLGSGADFRFRSPDAPTPGKSKR